MKKSDDLRQLAGVMDSLRSADTNKARASILMRELSANHRLYRYFASSIKGNTSRLATSLTEDEESAGALAAVLDGSLLSQVGVSKELFAKVSAKLGKTPITSDVTVLVSVTSDQALLAFSFIRASSIVLEGFGPNESETRAFVDRLRQAGIDVCLIGQGHDNA